MAVRNLKYPINTTDYDYQGKIHFDIVDEPELQITDEIISSASSFLQSSNPENPDSTSADDASVDETRFAGNLQEYQSFIDQVPSRDMSKPRCTLFLPQAIQIADGIDYENIDLGIMGSAVGTALREGEGAIGALKSALGGELDTITQAISSGAASEAGKIALSRAAAKYGSDSVRGGVLSATRRALNPNSRAFFKSVTTRSFSFQFKMIAESRQEAEEIKEIIKFFRQNMYPEDNPGGEFSLGYRFPPRFLIGMKYKNRDVATKILPSFLRSFTAAYNSTSMGMHTDGNFVEVDITLQFQESRVLKQSEIIEQGY